MVVHVIVDTWLDDVDGETHTFVHAVISVPLRVMTVTTGSVGATHTCWDRLQLPESLTQPPAGASPAAQFRQPRAKCRPVICSALCVVVVPARVNGDANNGTTHLGYFARQPHTLHMSGGDRSPRHCAALNVQRRNADPMPPVYHPTHLPSR